MELRKEVSGDTNLSHFQIVIEAVGVEASLGLDTGCEEDNMLARVLSESSIW